MNHPDTKAEPLNRFFTKIYLDKTDTIFMIRLSQNKIHTWRCGDETKECCQQTSSPNSSAENGFSFSLCAEFFSSPRLPIIHNTRNARAQRGPIVLFIFMDEDESEGEARMPK